MIDPGWPSKVEIGMLQRKRDLLISRLNEIGASLAESNKAIALIGLGSVGVELDRLDEFSDLDFFAIVEPGLKREFLEDIWWLRSICPIAYCFRNTPDGYKLLFQDGVFCELAVFEESELSHIPFSTGRIIWKKAGVPDTLAIPQVVGNLRASPSIEWSLGEALTNLYVGVCRFCRGEKLSAMRLIQGYAIDRVLELIEEIEPHTMISPDDFAPERRFEQRQSSVAELLPSFMQGYERSLQSARSILEFLDTRFEVNQFLKHALLDLFATAVPNARETPKPLSG
ncbi:MAG TPA: hypothetical protein VIS99_07190 [Terrimicrobiaceae bacterium]